MAFDLITSHASAALAAMTASGKNVVIAADAAAQRTALGLGANALLADVSCRTYNAGNLSITGDGNSYALTMDSEVYDTHNIHSTSSNPNRHTVPAGQGGKWSVEAKAIVANTVAVGISWMLIGRTTAIGAVTTYIAYDLAVNTLAGSNTFNLTAECDMADGDFFFLLGAQNTGNPRNFNGWTTSPNYGIQMTSKRIA